MDRHPIFFFTDWYIFEVVWWVLIRLICSRSHFYPFLQMLVNTSVNILYLLSVCVAP